MNDPRRGILSVSPKGDLLSLCGESRQRRIQGGKPFAKGFSPLKIPLFGRPKGACGPLWKPWGSVAQRRVRSRGSWSVRSRLHHAAVAVAGTSLLQKRGEIIKRGQAALSPLNRVFLLPLLSARAERNGAPAGRSRCRSSETSAPRRGRGLLRKNRFTEWVSSVKRCYFVSNYSIALSLRAILDFLFAALFLWIRFLPAALSTALTATL